MNLSCLSFYIFFFFQSTPPSPPGKSSSKMTHYYTPGMLPPPPPPPTLARPVAILRTSDGTVISSNSATSMPSTLISYHVKIFHICSVTGLKSLAFDWSVKICDYRKSKRFFIGLLMPQLAMHWSVPSTMYYKIMVLSSDHLNWRTKHHRIGSLKIVFITTNL